MFSQEYFMPAKAAAADASTKKTINLKWKTTKKTFHIHFIFEFNVYWLVSIIDFIFNVFSLFLQSCTLYATPHPNEKPHHNFRFYLIFCVNFRKKEWIIYYYLLIGKGRNSVKQTLCKKIDSINQLNGN